MLKEQLIEEAQTIDASVELDSVFESVELSDDVKENCQRRWCIGRHGLQTF